MPVGRSEISITMIIERVGNLFKMKFSERFLRWTPKGTFLVDNDELKIHKSILKLIEKGVSQEAFILLESSDDSFDFKIRERRFKLSYLFHILYNIPLRKYDSIKLSTCLINNWPQVKHLYNLITLYFLNTEQVETAQYSVSLHTTVLQTLHVGPLRN